jgi:alpha-N-arabinofuranosidase
MTRSARKPSLNCVVSLYLVALSTALAGNARAQMTESSPASSDAPINIRVTRPVRPQAIPSTLFGSFLEPIGHSTYGGLWADVVENPSFEEGLWSAANVENMLRLHPELRRASSLGLPLPWQPLDPSQGNRYSPVRGDASNSAQSILIMSLPGKEVGILQEVYLPVQRELNYRGSLWLKHVRGQGPVSITLRRHAHPDQALALTTVDASSTNWTKYSFQLELKPNQLAPLEPVDLVVSLSDDARALVDNVSLNPADAIDGMDPDVIAMARDLHSPVVRFGGNFTSAYDWNDGVGPTDKRVSKLNLSWGIPEYNTFGTDEFLRFCELIRPTADRLEPRHRHTATGRRLGDLR